MQFVSFDLLAQIQWQECSGFSLFPLRSTCNSLHCQLLTLSLFSFRFSFGEGEKTDPFNRLHLLH